MEKEILLTQIWLAVLYSVPMISGVICWIIIVFLHKTETVMEKRIRKVLGGFYIVVTVFWINYYFSDLNEEWLKYLIPLEGLIIQVAQVTFFHFVCIVTERKVSISKHYICCMLPVIIMDFVMFNYVSLQSLWTLSVLEFYEYFLNVFMFLTVVFYSFLSVKQLWQFQADLTRLSGGKRDGKELNWLVDVSKLRFMFAMFYMLDYDQKGWLMLVCVLLVVFQDVVLVFNLMQENYVIREGVDNMKKVMLVSGNVVPVVDDNVVVGDKSSYSLVTDFEKLITQEEFEEYFEKEKPFLKDDFRLESLVNHFAVNRTYLSKFINTTFGCNFSQYVNKWRLREVELLKGREENRFKKLEEIVENAGFRSIRSYWRVKKMNE